MRKIILILVMLLTVGCGNKLKCSYKETFDDIKIDNSITFNLKNNTYESKDIMVFKTSVEAKEYFKDVEDYIEEYNLVLNDNKIISELSGKLDSNKTKKELKKQYQSYDYTCK